MSNELLPCPFCGSECEMMIESSDWMVGCKNEDCYAIGQSFHSRQEATDWWNRRKEAQMSNEQWVPVEDGEYDMGVENEPLYIFGNTDPDVCTHVEFDNETIMLDLGMTICRRTAQPAPQAVVPEDVFSLNIKLSEGVYEKVLDEAGVASLSVEAIAEALVGYGLKYLSQQPAPQVSMPDDVWRAIRPALINLKMFYSYDGTRYGLDSDTIARFVSECNAALDWLQRQRPVPQQEPSSD